jgi:hypothetical protein
MWCHQSVALLYSVTNLFHYNVTYLVHHIANNLPHHMIIKEIFLKIIKVLDFLIANWLTAMIITMFQHLTS